MASAGDSGSSKYSSSIITDPTVVIPPVQELRSRSTITGQYTYKGKRRSQTLRPDAKAIGIKVFCIALGIGLIVWFITTPSFQPSGELTPPDSPPLLTAPEDPAPAPTNSDPAVPPGDTGDPKGSRENGSQGAPDRSETRSNSDQPLPSCQDQEPTQGDTGPDTPSPAKEDPNGEVGMMEINSSNDQENLK